MAAVRAHCDGRYQVLPEYMAGILVRSTAHEIQRNTPTSTPKPRFAVMPQACQSQSPAQVLVKAALSGRAVAEGSAVAVIGERESE